MLVAPLIVSRPGEGMSPSGSCELSGSTHPGEGPYACVNGRFYSAPAVRELAQALGLVVSDRVQAKIEQLMRELQAAHGRIESIGDENARLRGELTRARDELEAALRRADRAEKAKAAQKSAADFVAVWLERESAPLEAVA